jgi:hypothetical protein
MTTLLDVNWLDNDTHCRHGIYSPTGYNEPEMEKRLLSRFEEDDIAPPESYSDNVLFSYFRLQLQPGFPFFPQCSFKAKNMGGIGFVAPGRKIARYGPQVAAHALLLIL